MSKFLAFIFVVVCFLGVSARADSSALSVSKAEMVKSMDDLVAKGVIKADEAAAAKAELEKMSEEDLKKLHDKAQKLVQ